MKNARRWLRIFTAAAFAAVLLATPFLWQRFDGWLQDQRDRVWERLETLLGQKIAYDRIAPSVLAALDFQNVRLVNDGATVFKAASIRVSWDWGLVFQARFDQALRRIQIINGSIDLDTKRDAALLEHWQTLLKRPQGGGAPFTFQIEGFNLSGRLTDGTRSLSLERGFAVLSPEQKEWAVRFRGALSAEDTKTAAYARMSVRGEIRGDGEFQNFSVRSEASQVRTTWFDLEPVTLQVNIDPRLITVAKVSDRMPFDLQAEWDRESGAWEFKGIAEGFRPSQIIRLKGKTPWAGVADGTLTGRFSVQPDAFSFKGHASWPAGVLPAPLRDDAVEAAGSIVSQGSSYRFEGLRLETPRLSLQFDGDLSRDFLPQGRLALDRWTIPGVGQAKGLVHLTREGSKIAFSGENWFWNSLGSESPTGTVEKTTQGWAFTVEGPWSGTSGASFALAGEFHPNVPRFDATVDIIALPLSLLKDEALARLPGFDLPPAVWSLETTIRAQLGWGAAEGPSVSVTSFAFHDPLIPDRNGTGSAEWKGRHLELALNPTSWDSVRAGGRLSADLEDNGSVAGSLSGTLWDHPFDIHGRWVPSDRTLSFSGQPSMTGMVHQNDLGVWSAQWTLDPLTAVPGWTVGFDAEAQFDKVWTVDLHPLKVTGHYPWNGEAFSASATVHVDPGFVRFDDITLTDKHAPLIGALVSSWSGDFSDPWAGRLSLSSTERESIAIDWSAEAAQNWHFTVKASGVDATRSGLPALSPLSGRLTASGEAMIQGSDVSWSLQTALSESRWGESPLGFRSSFSGTTQHVSIRGLNLSVSPFRLVDGSGEWDAATHRWSASVGTGLRLGTTDWESRWSAEGTGEAENVTGVLTARSNTWAQRKFADWTMSGAWTPSAWNVHIGAGLVADGSPGRFTVTASDSFPVHGTAVGSWQEDQFNLAVKGFQADLGLVKELINTSFFSILSGNVEGDFTVGGNIADPEVNGKLLFRNLNLNSSFVPRPVGPLEIPVVLEGHRVRIDPVNIAPGRQVWMVSGGARLDHLLPEEYQFSLQTDEFSAMPVSYQYTGISALGSVGGLLLIKGTPQTLTLGGRLVAQDTVITLRPVPPETPSGEPLGFNVDLTIVTGRKVEFLWPNETLPLLSAITSPGQIMTIKTNDIASTWSVAGKMGLRAGEINYLNRTFLVKEGQLVFQEDQTKFDPRINVRAEWKLREASGPVIISLRADGTLGTFSPRFDAEPYRSTEELQQLIGTTLALPTDYTSTNVDAALSVASDVGTSFLLTPFEEAVKKTFQLDLFTVKTEILKKSVLNRNAVLEASDYLDNTRLFFGKYIGDDLFLQGTLVFRRDNDAAQGSTKLVVEPEFQMEFQTPLFLLDWTLLPQHPKTLFVTDNTVTFRWNWSY